MDNESKWYWIAIIAIGISGFGFAGYSQYLDHAYGKVKIEEKVK